LALSILKRDGELPARFLAASDRQEQLHRRRPELKIHGEANARAMVRELGIVSVNAATILPNLIDPLVGRRASGAERVYTEPASTVKSWLPAILADQDIIEMKLFNQEATLVHRSLWPLIDPVARHFGRQARDGELLSPMGRKFLATLDKQGPMRVDRMRKELGIRTVVDSKAYKLARAELDGYFLILTWDDPASPRDPQRVIYETWDRFSNRSLDQRLVPTSLAQAWTGLAEAVLKAAVLAPAKGVFRWFPWTRDDCEEALQELLRRNVAEHLEVQREPWIFSRP
jgi:hypothetical protein